MALRMRIRRALQLGALGLMAAAAPRPATAQTLPEATNANGERLTPAMSQEGIINVESAEISGRATFDTHLWFNYNKNPMRLFDGAGAGEQARFRPAAEEGMSTQPEAQDGAGLVRNRFDGNLIVSFGLWERIELGANVPFTFQQSRPSDVVLDGADGKLGALRSMGVGDIIIQPKVRLLKAKDALVDLAIYAPISLPTGNQANYFGDPSVTVSPALAISREFAVGTRVAANFGYRIRPEFTVVSGVPIDDQFRFGVGVGHRFKKAQDIPLGVAISFTGEIPGIKDDDVKALTPKSGYANPMELLASLEYDVSKEIQFFAGGGFGLGKGQTAPDFRVFGGAKFYIRDRDADSDGIEDDKDQCRTEAEDLDKIQDTDGCPETDADGDGVADEADGAPLDAEDKDNFEDADGVPDPDNDKDGFLDGADKCPTEAGIAENEGCPDRDRDGDGIVDRLDKCADAAEDKDGFQDEDGCVDADNDNDGVVDAKDQCVDKAGPVENRGCPDTDRDGDSVVDRLDNCPDEAGTADNKGCKAKQLVEITKEKLVILDKVYFGSGSDKILPKSFTLLNNVASVLKTHPEVKKVVVEGHTDNKGKPEANKALSQKRAESVVAYLVKQGVEPARLSAAGYGQEKPIASNDTEPGRAENRRVDFVLPSE
jgi:outer membrane protein OmpA-like peptidoglycan-associated protein